MMMMSCSHIHSNLHSIHYHIPFIITFLVGSFCLYAFFFVQIPSLLSEQPISVLDREYEEVAAFLNEYSCIHASLMELSVSHQLVDWLKEAMKGISLCFCSDT